MLFSDDEGGSTTVAEPPIVPELPTPPTSTPAIPPNPPKPPVVPASQPNLIPQHAFGSADDFATVTSAVALPETGLGPSGPTGPSGPDAPIGPPEPASAPAANNKPEVLSPSQLVPHEFGADDLATMPGTPAFTEEDRRSFMNSISPGPAAQRREAPPEPRDPVHARRARDSVPPAIPTRTPNKPSAPNRSGPVSPTAFLPSNIPSVLSPNLPRAKTPSAAPLPRGKKPSMAPAPRGKAPTLPPPIPNSGPQRPSAAVLPPPGPHAEMRPLTPPPVAEPTPPPSPAYPAVAGSASDPIHIAAIEARGGATPPPTRIQRPEGDRPFTPPRVLPIPEIPESGLLNAAKYSVEFVRARWQRRGAIKTLGAEIKQDTEALDQVLGALGREARTARVEGRVFSAENAAIDAAQGRIDSLSQEVGDVDARRADENSRYVDVERERNTKLTEAGQAVEQSQQELAHLEGQRRLLRDKRKELERRQKTYLKNAEDDDRAASTAQVADTRADHRRSAEGHRKEAAAIEPERQDIDRRLAALERPIGEVSARLDAAKAELDAAKRSLTDAREGHGHRLAELEAEQKRKSREIGLAEAEIQRRLVTLGTLVNLNRIDNAAFAELYERIDRIRGAITARTTEIEKLNSEREAYDRGSLIRGAVTIGGAIVALIALIVILLALI